MDVIGHTLQKQFLHTVISRETVGHAYLLLGPSNVGKSTAAASFVEELLGMKGQDTSHGQDPWATVRKYPDCTILEREDDVKTGKRKKNISIEQIRQLRERLSLGSFLSSWKIGVIVEADTMSTEAANALLKTIEEPTKNTLIMLTASSSESVPATIKSRCQVLRFSLVPEKQIFDGLLARGVASSLAEELAHRAEGRPGKAVSLFEEPDMKEKDDAKARAFANILGAPMWQRLAFLDTVLPQTKGTDVREEAHACLSIWESLLRDGLLFSLNEPTLLAWHVVRDQIVVWAAKKKTADIVKAIACIPEARRSLLQNVSPKAALEHVLLST